LIEETKTTFVEHGSFDLRQDVLKVLDIATEVKKGEVGEDYTSERRRVSACSMGQRSRVLESKFK
jgi:hypothetical protein